MSLSARWSITLRLNEVTEEAAQLGSTRAAERSSLSARKPGELRARHDRVELAHQLLVLDRVEIGVERMEHAVPMIYVHRHETKRSMLTLT